MIDEMKTKDETEEILDKICEKDFSEIMVDIIE